MRPQKTPTSEPGGSLSIMSEFYPQSLFSAVCHDEGMGSPDTCHLVLEQSPYCVISQLSGLMSVLSTSHCFSDLLALGNPNLLCSLLLFPGY